MGADAGELGLSRSWEELHADIVRRGRKRRRRGLAMAWSPAVVLVLIVVGVIVATTGRGSEVGVRTVDQPPPAPPVLHQRVAFVRLYEGGDRGSRIVVMDGDGSDVESLSSHPEWNDGSPAFSPSGSLIAFQSERDNPLRGIKRITDVYVMRPDGTDVRRVTTTSRAGVGNGVRHPAWSPDGEWLAVAREGEDDASRIELVRPDGSGLHAITDGPGDVGPTFSPDGAWIAFRRRPGGVGDEELWLVRPDGTGARRVAAPVDDSSIAWSPDGRLTFSIEVEDGSHRIVSAATDGGDRRLVSVGPGVEDREPAWSSDGRLVVYWSDPDGQFLVDREVGQPPVTSGGRAPGGLVLAEPGGSVERVLTQPADGQHDASPTLGPPTR